MHGGVAKDDLGKENVAAVAKGCDNLERHLRERPQVRRAGGGRDQPLHHRHRRPRSQRDARTARRAWARRPFLCTHWADGGKGTEALAQQGGRRSPRAARRKFKPLYPDEMPLLRQDPDHRHARSTAPTTSPPTRRCADQLQGAAGRRASATCRSASPRRSTRFSTDPERSAARRRATSCRSARCGCRPAPSSSSSICGEIMTMPGLPKVPSAESHPPQRAGPDRGPVLWRRRTRPTIETTEPKMTSKPKTS